MEQLAKLIESRMRGQWEHAAVHESDLQCIWPLNDQDRERKIAEFATHYGFRLRFYTKGMCAIFVRNRRAESCEVQNSLQERHLYRPECQCNGSV
jgi:hypothetical protein